MTTMYDSVTPGDIPADAEMVAGYCTGRYAWPAGAWARFSTPRKVEIATQARFNTGDVLDVEQGDATPAEAPGWIRMRKAAGYWRPTIYCGASSKAAVVAACYHEGLVLHADYELWVAHYTGGPHAEPDAVATQYADAATSGGHFDLSLVIDDAWPHRTAPAPTPPPEPPAQEDNEDMKILRVVDGPEKDSEWLQRGKQLLFLDGTHAQQAANAGAPVGDVQEPLWSYLKQNSDVVAPS